MKSMKNKVWPGATDASPHLLIKFKTSVHGFMSCIAKYKSMTRAQEVA